MIKCQLLHLDHINPMQHRLGEEWLESCPEEKHLGMLVNSQMSMSSHPLSWAGTLTSSNRSSVLMRSLSAEDLIGHEQAHGR